MATKMSTKQSQTSLTNRTQTSERSLAMKKFAQVIAHSALIATLVTLLSAVANASAIWGN